MNNLEVITVTEFQSILYSNPELPNEMPEWFNDQFIVLKDSDIESWWKSLLG